VRIAGWPSRTVEQETAVEQLDAQRLSCLLLACSTSPRLYCRSECDGVLVELKRPEYEGRLRAPRSEQ